MPKSKGGSARNTPDPTAARKSSHVDIVLKKKVDYKKTTGLEVFEFVHNALPEIDYAEIDTHLEFLTFGFSAPIIVSSMTGGFSRAGYINSALAEFCKEKNIGMGVGSQRQALEKPDYLETFKAVRKISEDIFVMGNIGAAQVASGFALTNIRRIIDAIQADALAIHLNPLQELIQPEGDRDFRGVLNGISELVKKAGVPIIVKETGAGISGEVAGKLIDVGVSAIDVSGAGGTSWAAIETMRQSHRAFGNKFWDWGIPTAESLVQVNSLPSRKKFSLISSGGIRDGIDTAKSLALGADICSSAQPFLKALDKRGVRGLVDEFDAWIEELKGAMFLTGSKNIDMLKRANLRKVGS